MREPMPELKPRYEEFAEASSLFTDPAAAALRTSPLAQFWRELLLARSMIDQGLYDEGYLVTIAPALNYHVQDAAEAYQAHLREPEDGWASRPWSGCSKGPRTARRSGGRRRGAGTVGRTGPSAGRTVERASAGLFQRHLSSNRAWINGPGGDHTRNAGAQGGRRPHQRPAPKAYGNFVKPLMTPRSHHPIRFECRLLRPWGWKRRVAKTRRRVQADRDGW